MRTLEQCQMSKFTRLRRRQRRPGLKSPMNVKTQNPKRSRAHQEFAPFFIRVSFVIGILAFGLGSPGTTGVSRFPQYSTAPLLQFFLWEPLPKLEAHPVDGFVGPHPDEPSTVDSDLAYTLHSRPETL